MPQILVVIGAGSIGQAIARRVGAGKHVLLADLNTGNAEAAAKTLDNAGFTVSTATVDVSSRASVEALAQKAAALGEVWGLIHAAGVSPSQASPETILKVDLYGTALVLEVFGDVMARGGSGIVIASQSGHACRRCRPSRTRRWRARRSKNCWHCPCCNPTRSRTRCTPTSFPSAAIPCGRWPRQCAGANAERGSTPSAPASSSRRWRMTN